MASSCAAPLAHSCAPVARGRLVCLLALSALLATIGPITASDAATLAVGPGKRYATIASAVAAAREGDVVEVQQVPTPTISSRFHAGSALWVSAAWRGWWRP